MSNETPPAVLVSVPPQWRVQLVRALQLVGILGGFLGGADFLQLLAIMPPDVSAWLLVAGPAFAAASKPAVLLIGDLVDDGIKNDSFKLPLVLFFAGLAALGSSVLLQSCANFPGLGLTVTEDGCALASYTDPKTGQTFKAGPCPGPDGTVERYVTEWTNAEGVRIRATRPAKGGATVFWYQDAGVWVQWSSKAGMTLGAVPTASP